MRKEDFVTGEINRQWVLVQRPQGAVTESTFELRRRPIPVPADGQALVRVASGHIGMADPEGNGFCLD